LHNFFISDIVTINVTIQLIKGKAYLLFDLAKDTIIEFVIKPVISLACKWVITNIESGSVFLSLLI
jgi:hypothetical protein